MCQLPQKKDGTVPRYIKNKLSMFFYRNVMEINLSVVNAIELVEQKTVNT